jgi:Circularly permutated YpsA SLOG family
MIITDGQSGVDRAALDTAIERGLDYGGWCPKGGWAEDMAPPHGLLARYPKLKETPSADPAERTRWNVRNSDAILILVARGGLAASGGTQLAADTAGKLGKPTLTLDLDDPAAPARLKAWLAEVKPAKLGIGGPRESEAPGIYEKARRVLGEGLGRR